MDMLVYDTSVIINLIQYAVIISHPGDTNSTIYHELDISGAVGVIGVIILVLCLIYVFSMFALLTSPWLSSLLTSFKTSRKLLKEDRNTVTDIGN